MIYFFLLFAVFSFVFGTIAGSFLGVVICRLPEGKSIVSPGSRCDKCQTPISWYDNIPILSWLLLGGKCRACKASIPTRFLFFELAVGFMSVLFFFYFGMSFDYFYYFAFACSLFALTFIDLEHMIIPDELSLGMAVVGLAGAYFSKYNTVLDAVLGGLLGFGLFFLVMFAFEKIRKKEGLGGGDVKLMASVGAFTGIHGVLVTMLIGCFSALLFNFKKRDQAFPFGPFLALGALVSIFYRHQIFFWYSHLFR